MYQWQMEWKPGIIIENENENEDGNPFAVPDLWKISTLGTHFDGDDDDHATTLRLESLHDDGALRDDESNVELRVIGDDLKAGLSLLDLELPTFEYGPVLEVEDVGVLKEDEEVASLESLDAVEGEEEDEDVWTSRQVTESQTQSTDLIKSWETVYGDRVQQARTVYLSDGGAGVYDAALVKSAESAAGPESISGHIIRSDAILSSLTQLAMGRESVLYRFSEEEKTFKPRKNHIRMSGYSLQTFNSLSEALSLQGNRFRDLRAFVAQTYGSSSTTAFPAQVALAGAFVPILASLEAQIGSPLIPVCSLLQLQALVERPGQVVRCLCDVVVEVRGARTEEELLSRMLELVQSAEYAPQWLLSTLQRLLAAVSRPWLESVEGWVGLYQGGSSSSSSSFKSGFPAFVVPGKKDAIADGGNENESAELTFAASAMPSFVSAEDASMIFETGQNLRLLEKHQPEHLLVNESVLPSDTSSALEWQFTWRDIENVTTKANKYESSLRKALKDFYSDTSATDSALHSSSQSKKSMQVLIDQSTQSTQSFPEISSSAFEAPLPDLYSSPPFQSPDTDTEAEASSPFAPPLSLIPTLSFMPLISVRARLINNATLRLLFKTHHLQSHLSLLHRFLLLSDSTFTSRLSHALFSHNNDPPSNTSFHPNNNATGLKLNTRSTWPPTSSELRLALSGVLADDTTSSTSTSALSFAIRPLTPETLPTDPTALQALDFLRLQYTAPPPLDCIITPASLATYEGIFTFLLRCLRLRMAVTGLFPGTLKLSRRGARFRWEAQCFVNCVCGWAVEDCVKGRWRVFEGEVWGVERGVFDDDRHDRHGDGKEREGKKGDSSIIHLRTLHTRFLEDVSASLFLHPPFHARAPSPLKRDRDSDEENRLMTTMMMMAMLEEIFTLVLRFVALVQHRDRHRHRDGHDVEADEEKEISTLYSTFQQRVEGFVGMCRRDGVALGSGLGREGDQVRRETMAALAGRLEVAGFGI